MKKIIKTLCPDIIEWKNDKIIDDYSTDSAFSAAEKFAKQVISHYKQFPNMRERLWITGNASMGKSTTINILKLECIKYGVTFYYLNLKLLEYDYSALKIALDNALIDDKVEFIILDSYDEINATSLGADEIDKINKIIKTCPKSIIVASRSNVETDKTFDDFIKIELQSFEEDQLYSLISNRIEIGEDEVSQQLLNTLNNTMLIAMFVEIFQKAKEKKDDEKMKDLLNLNCEAELYFEYFKMICIEKPSNKDKKITAKHIEKSIETVDDFLMKIGEYYYNFYMLHNNDMGVSNKDIPKEFSTIYYIDTYGVVGALHQEYIDFSIGYFFARKLMDNHIPPINIFNIPLNHFEQRRAFLYAGQCLRFLSRSIRSYKILPEGKEVFKKLNEKIPKCKTKEYAWLIHIWASFCGNVLKSDETFQIGKPFVGIVKKFGFYGINKLEMALSPLNLGDNNYLLWDHNGNSYLCAGSCYFDDSFLSSYELDKYLKNNDIKPKGYTRYRFCESIKELIELGMDIPHWGGIKENILGTVMYMIILGGVLFGGAALSSTYFVIFTDNIWETFVWWQYMICLLASMLISFLIMLAIGCIIYRGISKTKIKFVKELQTYLFNVFKIDMEIKANGSMLDFDFRYKILK